MKRGELKKLALSAVLCALSVVLVLIGGLFDIFDITAAALASGAVAFAVIELKGKYPILIFLVTAALSLVLFATSTAAIYYAAFLGYYPTLKPLLERLPKGLRFFAKLLLLCAAVTLLLLFARWVFLAPETVLSAPVIALLYACVILFFLVYDKAITVLETAYRKHFRTLWGVDRWLAP